MLLKKIVNPDRSKWSQLVKRPTFEKQDLSQKVQDILRDVQNRGDKALKELTSRFQDVKLEDLKVSEAEMVAAEKLVPQELKDAIAIAAQNIEKFHASQAIEEPKVITMEGVECWRKSIPISSVGLYIPGGSAPLFSTLLMLAIPAKLAGCKDVVVCTPCDEKGEINPTILYVVRKLGLTNIFKIGGAQAIAAMGYGTESINKVSKIFGPGNQFVTEAKEQIQRSGIAIDMPAGPSEVLIIADQSSNPSFVAADLLSQAEHGPDSQVLLVTTNEIIVNEVQKEIATQLKDLPRKEVASEALKNSYAIVLPSLEECIHFSNYYAPEHLIIATDNALKFTDSIINAGSVFMGKYTCESAGDYASGTNHTLPTNGYADRYSGVSLDSYLKKITFQTINETGIQNLGKTIEVMAEAEGLFAHKNAVSVRLNSLKK